jgi:hypothetical protein
MPKKRGGARPGAGRKHIFTDLQQWVIGGTVHNRMWRNTQRRFERKTDEMIFEDNNLALEIERLHAVPDEYKATMELKAKFRRRIKQPALDAQLAKINDEWDYAFEVNLKGQKIPVPKKVTDGIRRRVIRAMGRLLRRKGFKVADATVNDYLEKFRKMQAVPLDGGDV